jgi:hypothetical protein
MSLAALIVEPNSVKTRKGGPATGNIWLEINGAGFPKQHWNDFVVVLLGWWVNALLRLIHGARASQEVHFMEGPYAVELTKAASGTLQLRAFECATPTKEIAAGEVAIGPFITGLIAQSRELLDVCRELAWWSKDADELESSLNHLEKKASSGGYAP